MTDIPKVGGYTIEVLVQGFPGKSLENGGLGWSAIVLLRGHGRIVLVDTGSFSVRQVLVRRLRERGIARSDVTDVLLTHSHYDHVMNWNIFPDARVAISSAELEWSLRQPIEGSLVAELHMRELASSAQLHPIRPGDEVLPNIRSLEMPGHTPHHLVFVVEEKGERVIIAADAVKNRAELFSCTADLTLDAEASKRSITALKSLWEERTGTILIAGHDLPMLNTGRGIALLGTRRAAITARFSESFADETRFNLVEPESAPIVG
jgi:N-acyl homoserine lactone hydrolase